MTKSTITRERLGCIASWRAKYSSGHNVVLPAEEAEELARIALGAMDSEPVAYAWVSRSGKKHLTRCEPEQWRDAVIVTPLYPHAQPAPVITFYSDGIEAAAKWIDQQREAYDSKHVWSDPDTGTFEFGNDAQRDYSSTLEELAEGIRALHPNAGNSPVIPDGYVMVPKVPTEDMIVAGFESEPDEPFSEPEVWEEYQIMSGCQQAAHRARLCWAAMLAAIPPAPKN